MKIESVQRDCDKLVNNVNQEKRSLKHQTLAHQEVLDGIYADLEAANAVLIAKERKADELEKEIRKQKKLLQQKELEQQHKQTFLAEHHKEEKEEEAKVVQPVEARPLKSAKKKKAKKKGKKKA